MGHGKDKLSSGAVRACPLQGDRGATHRFPLIWIPLIVILQAEAATASSTDRRHKFVSFNTYFSFRLYKKVVSYQVRKNVFFYPVSISTTPVMLALGAKPETQSFVSRGLGFNLSELEEREIHRGFCQFIHRFNLPREKIMKTGNVLFLEESLKVLPKFLEAVEMPYQVETISTNFLNATAAIQQINDYVKNKTYGEINNAITSLSTYTVMILVNYIYFKGFESHTTPPLHIKFNKPFLLFIIDKSKGTILLMGKIVNPTKK
ncbi:serpin A3-5-like [Eublepharis macularius]|uniref:Serpin A3-5-like n=1 Tax=Eublepharis macularius TaxID=481883 RepID=A0AA97KRQ3_EUBMA|nr:serpin A3-5-like [Eublepharis macularius]